MHVRRGAVAELTPQAQIAVPTRQVLLDGDPVALGNAPSTCKGAARLRDRAHVFVAEDLRPAAHAFVATDVAAAHTGGLDFEKRCVSTDVREREFAQLGRLGRDLYGGQH